MRDDLPVVSFSRAEDWEHWLDRNGGDAPGVWVKIAKKGAGQASISAAEAVEGALCFGWIDGRVGRYDDQWFALRFTPRRPRSRWSEVNCAAAERLIAAGRMRSAGLAEVERAKSDGRWEAAYGRRAFADIPDDLQAALDANPAALSTWDGLSATNVYSIKWHIHDAKRPETRARRIAAYVDMLAEGQTPH